MWNKNRAQNEKQASCICIYISVTKAKLVSTSPLEVPRDPLNDWFEFLDLETVTIGFLVKFYVGIVVLFLF